MAFVHDTSARHFPAWAAFSRADGTAGFWHETYLIERGKYETIYANMGCSALPPRPAMREPKASFQPRETACAGISCRLGREKRRPVAFLARAC